jgi:cell division septal protein FtsQ
MRANHQSTRKRPRQRTSSRQPHAYGYNAGRVWPGLRLQAAPLSGSRKLAVLLFVAVLALVAWCFLDSRFYIYEYEVSGNVLLSAAEVYKASGLESMSAFYLDRAKVVRQIQQAIPGVTAVRVEYRWPSQVILQIQEQDVRFVWHTEGGPTFLVDGSGLVLKMDAGAGGDLLDIRDLDATEYKLGDRVDRVALDAASGLHRLLPEAELFDYSRSKGISWVNEQGWRIYFGNDQELTKKVACMRTLTDRILSSGKRVEFIDVRFVDSAYYR